MCCSGALRHSWHMQTTLLSTLPSPVLCDKKLTLHTDLMFSLLPSSSPPSRDTLVYEGEVWFCHQWWVEISLSPTPPQKNESCQTSLVWDGSK